MVVKSNLMDIRIYEYQEGLQEFSERIGVHYKTYYNWETGATRPTLAKALEVAKTLQKPVDDIWYLE